MANSFYKYAGLMAIVFSLSSCAPGHEKANDAHKNLAQTQAQPENDDPLEGFNRGVFAFNEAADTVVLRPVTKAYRAVMPEKGRTMVTNFVGNLYSPVVFANSVLQADPQNSFATLWRFVLNTTLGVGGLFDFASEVGLKNRTTDLGQTLALDADLGTGAYIVLPIIGPSNMRDAFGRLGDAFMMPTNYMDTAISASTWGLTALDSRSNSDQIIDDIYANSLDPYSTFRSGYTQKREADIRRARAARKSVFSKTCSHQ